MTLDLLQNLPDPQDWKIHNLPQYVDILPSSDSTYEYYQCNNTFLKHKGEVLRHVKCDNFN